MDELKVTTLNCTSLGPTLKSLVKFSTNLSWVWKLAWPSLPEVSSRNTMSAGLLLQAKYLMYSNFVNITQIDIDLNLIVI